MLAGNGDLSDRGPGTCVGRIICADVQPSDRRRRRGRECPVSDGMMTRSGCGIGYSVRHDADASGPREIVYDSARSPADTRQLSGWLGRPLPAAPVSWRPPRCKRGGQLTSELSGRPGPGSGRGAYVCCPETRGAAAGARVGTRLALQAACQRDVPLQRFVSQTGFLMRRLSFGRRGFLSDS